MKDTQDVLRFVDKASEDAAGIAVDHGGDVAIHQIRDLDTVELA